MKVRNEKATKCDCGCENWLDHWYRNSKGFYIICSGKNCIKDVQIGGQIKKTSINDLTTYIVPLCLECSKLSIDYEIDRFSTIVPSGKQFACDQKRVKELLI